MSVYARTVVLALTLALSLPACIFTTALTDKALARRSDHPYPIVRVRGALTRDQQVFLLLDVQADDQATHQTIVWSIPIRELASRPRASAEAEACEEVQTFTLLPKLPAGSSEADDALPDSADPIPIEYLTTAGLGRGSSEIPADSLSAGLHVIIHAPADGERGPKTEARETRDGTLVPGANLVLIWRGAKCASAQHTIGPFMRPGKKHEALLVLTPLAVVGDVVMAPFFVPYWLFWVDHGQIM